MEGTDKKRGRWKPGQSGNPRGKPRGSGQLQKLRDELSERLPEILEAMTERAIAGDMAATKLILERVLPPLRPVELPCSLNLPDGTLAEQARAALAAAGTGQLPPGTAAQLIGAISNLAKIIEVAELEDRIKALEAHYDTKQ